MHAGDLSHPDANEVHCANEAEMLALGHMLAPCLIAGDCVALFGDLGAGKTTLIRGILTSIFGNQTEVPSPTFTLVQTYADGKGLSRNAPPVFWHFDLYRLNQPDDVFEIGWEAAMEDISLIEWPERAGEYLPPDTLRLSIHHTSHDARTLVFEGMAWSASRFAGMFGNRNRATPVTSQVQNPKI